MVFQQTASASLCISQEKKIAVFSTEIYLRRLILSHRIAPIILADDGNRK